MSEIYYVDSTGGQAGPVSKADFANIYQSGGANDSTMVWYDGLAGWSTIADIPGFADELRPKPAVSTAPRFALPTTLPTLKKVEASPQPSPSPKAAAAGNDLFAAIAARKAQMAQQGDNVDADRMVGNKDHLNIEEDMKPKQTFAVPQAPPKKEGADQINWKVLKSPDGAEYYFNVLTNETTWTKPKELLSSDELNRLGSKWVWKEDEYQAFVPAKVLEGYNDQYHHLETEDGQQFHNIKKTVELDTLHWESLRAGSSTSDLVLLDEMSLPLILHTLKARFQTNQIYTNVGTILIALNPYKRFPDLYTPDAISQYASRGTKWVPPHVYLVASEALNQLLETKLPQSICISGESGAGKTECTKQALQYIADCAGSNTSNVEQKILASNPILEAFGNAKTVRNNNSSRFGKYVEINFDHNMLICGSTNTNYLLEKVRVVRPNRGERNYHSFYQLLRGAPDDVKNKYFLKNVQDYSILTVSNSVDVDGVDDKQEHQDVLHAMHELGWSQSDIDHVYTTLSAVLHIGNIQFQETGDRKCKVVSQEPIDHCCQLLKMDKTAFTKAVTVRVMRVIGQADIDVTLGKDEAEQARDALAKFIYEKMFDWIVERINSSIGKGVPAVHEGRACTIGILDIFGFEIFEHNQFEQLCINFTNEKLQQFFNQHTFKKEEEVYRFEGISFDQVAYIDNQPMLDLIELRPKGILPLVDEEIKMPKGSDKTFVQKLCQAQKPNKYFKSFLKNPEMFVVEHYAGSVTYDSNGFLEKNRDRLNDDAYKAIAGAGFPFLVALFQDTNPASRATLGTKFAKQLNDLMAALNLTQPHYIRCVKPNPNKAPLEFHPVMVLEQLKYSGVFEAVKIRKLGFPFRYTHANFWKRFKCILPPTTQWSGDMVANCKRLITELKQTTALVQIGKTRILYRAPQHRDMELIRNLAVDKVTIKIQQQVRAWLARRIQKKCQAAQPKLQQAINTRTLQALHSTIDSVGNLGFDLYELTRARRLIFVINEENRLEKLIGDLLNHHNIEAQYDILERCIAEADDIELKSNVAERARVVLKEIQDKRQARDWLVSGPAEADQEKCEWAVATAQRLRMPESTAAAVAMIERCKQETAICAEMTRCMSYGGYTKSGDSINAAELRAIVDKATAFQCKTKSGVLIYNDAAVIALVRDTLKQSLGTKDRDLWKATGNACKAAIDHMAEHPEVVKASEEVSYQLSVDEVTDALTEGLRELSQEVLTYNLAQAEKLKVDEVKYPVVPQSREILSKIIEAKRLMTDAVESVDEVKLMYAVQYAEAFNYEKPQTQQCRQLRDFVMQVCSDAEYALEILEEQHMRDVLTRAGQVRLVTPQTQELQKHLASGDEKFLQAQLKQANKLKDEPRVIRLTIKLKELMLLRQPEQFQFAKYGRLRTPMDWANLKLVSLNREKLAASFYNHTTDVIHTPLIELDTSNPKSSDNAKKIFKNILGIFGDRQYGQPVPLILNCLQLCLDDPSLRDEMVCQIVKQLTNNTNMASEQKGWQLLHVFLEQFAPKEVENFLIQWIKKNAKGGSDKYLRSLHLSSFYGGKTQLLSELEINKIISSNSSLRDTNYEVVRPYQPPNPNIPPVGQAVDYYQRWVLKNQEKAQQKEKEMREAAAKMLELGGTTVAKQAEKEMQTKMQEQYVPPPPAPSAQTDDYTNKPLPPGWQTAYSPDGALYYWSTSGSTCWEKSEIWTQFNGQ